MVWFFKLFVPLDAAVTLAFAGQVDGRVRVGHADKRLDTRLKRRRVQEGSELGRYLAAYAPDTGEDILGWWKHHSREYPCLARIARDYLAIPATSVPAERVFSGGADLITDKRGSLNEDTIQAHVCLDSWKGFLTA